METTIGKRHWAVAEGHIPGGSHGPAPDLTSHEAVCILNAASTEAHIELTVFFSDRDPAGPYRLTVPARRTRHVRLNNLDDPETIPKDTDFSFTLDSDVPVVVQYTRLDSRQAANALLSTIAFGAD